MPCLRPLDQLCSGLVLRGTCSSSMCAVHVFAQLHVEVPHHDYERELCVSFVIHQGHDSDEGHESDEGQESHEGIEGNEPRSFGPETCV